jgi:hypothetical protein
MKNIKRFNRLFQWEKNYDGSIIDARCNIGPYELDVWNDVDVWLAKVDSMTLLANPLVGINYPSRSEAMAACQSAVLKIERETAALQRFAK